MRSLDMENPREGILPNFGQLKRKRGKTPAPVLEELMTPTVPLPNSCNANSAQTKTQPCTLGARGERGRPAEKQRKKDDSSSALPIAPVLHAPRPRRQRRAACCYANRALSSAFTSVFRLHRPHPSIFHSGLRPGVPTLAPG